MKHGIPKPYYANVDSRGRIVVRKDIRSFMGLPQGGRIEWLIDEGGNTIIRAASKDEAA